MPAPKSPVVGLGSIFNDLLNELEVAGSTQSTVRPGVSPPSSTSLPSGLGALVRELLATLRQQVDMLDEAPSASGMPSVPARTSAPVDASTGAKLTAATFDLASAPTSIVRAGGATSAEGRRFTDLINRTMEQGGGGYGMSGLTEAWDRITDPAERASIGRSISDVIAARGSELDAAAAEMARTNPQYQDLSLLQLRRQAIDDIARVTGLQAPARGAGAGQLTQWFSSRIGTLEDRATSLVLRTSNAGTPDVAAFESLSEEVAVLATTIALAGDPALKARLDAIPTSAVAATAAGMQLDEQGNPVPAGS